MSLWNDRNWGGIIKEAVVYVKKKMQEGGYGIPPSAYPPLVGGDGDNRIFVTDHSTIRLQK